MKLRRLLLFALVSCELSSPLLAQKYEGRELVQAKLISDTSAIVSGKPFTVGLLLHMVPGWHTYWQYPGDAGIPTEMKWQVPPGWKVDPIQWPLPLKLNEPGDIQIYGYHDEVLLMQRITPPAAIAASKINLQAKADWLVCEKICIPGGATVALDLPVAASGAAANTEVFNRFRRSLPQDWPGSSTASYRWERGEKELRLLIESAALDQYPSIDFFPLPQGNLVPGHPRVEKSSGRVVVRIPMESPPPNLKSLDGVVVFGQQENSVARNGWSLGASGPAPAAAVSSSSGPEKGILRFLLLGFLGGFILNLMPCVLPVISLKIFGFVRQAGDSRAGILRNGLAFIAGIFVWFVGLAVVLIALKSAGHELTWAVQFTNPWFVLAMSVVVLIFALNLFGVFEIQLPQSASGGLLAVSSREGAAGSFFQGIFATILATPCTAPFLGTALGFAFTQSAFVILVMFVAIAAGMSAPYLLLSAQPAWLRFLPKPGPWMERVKQLMGFFLLATLLFLLSVLGAQRGLTAVVWASAFLLVVSLACWMKGAFITLSASAAGKAVTVVLMILLLGASGAYFLGSKFHAAHLDATSTPADAEWQSFTPERVQAELAKGHPVFVDFTAAWCITCKFNETTVLETDAVRGAFRRNGVVKLKADWTNADPVITKTLKQFGRPGVPLYVLYPGQSGEPIVFPELLTKGIVLEKLQTLAPQVASK